MGPHLPFKPPRVQLSLLSSCRARRTVSGERLFDVCVFSHHLVSVSLSIYPSIWQSRRANLRHELARATPPVKNTGAVSELLRKTPEVHVATFLILSGRLNLTLYGVAMVTR